MSRIRTQGFLNRTQKFLRRFITDYKDSKDIDSSNHCGFVILFRDARLSKELAERIGVNRHDRFNVIISLTDCTVEVKSGASSLGVCKFKISF